MAKRKKPSKKHTLNPDFQSRREASLARKHRKTVLFNEKEISVINSYCKKYSITNKSAFIRGVVISHILEQVNENYPKLF